MTSLNIVYLSYHSTVTLLMSNLSVVGNPDYNDHNDGQFHLEMVYLVCSQAGNDIKIQFYNNLDISREL